ncbi:MAG: hypothetical protein K9M80_01935 [Candidatus Marinimicrobia bacterium]|nr:hypothetical protein [Candidatus Neomarinimicrobiota bacterium]
MKKIKTELVFLIIILFSIPIFANPLQGKKVLYMPMKYNQPASDDSLGVDISKVADSERMSIIWEVYSDRSNNLTFHSPRGEQYKQAGFMEQFFVLEERAECLHIVKDPNLQKDTLSAEAVDYGWIPKQNLLLWSNNLVTQKGQINRKAMILNTVEQLKSENAGDKPDIVRFRESPVNNAQLTGEESRLFQFFYIFKKSENGDYLLLGKNSFFGETSVNTVIKGWVPNDRSVLWFNRVAIEPNWEYEAVQERKNGKKAKFFSNIDAARSFKLGAPQDKKDIIWKNDPLSSERLIGEWRRFPVLRNDPADPAILNTGVMGDIYTEQGKKLAKMSEKIAKTQNKIDKLIAQKRKIKIVFVVDGTRSMQKVFKAVSQAIRNSTKDLNLEYRNKYGENAIDFAGVIYRDYSESRRLRVRTRGFKSTQSFESFFNPEKAKDISNNTHAEAPYLGLETALKSLGLKEDETNVIIQLGDAGNHVPDQEGRTPEKIAEMMADNYCHYISIQVHKPSVSQVYDNFTSQSKKIALQAAQKYHRILSEKYKGLFNLSDLEWEIEGGNYNLKESPLAAKVVAMDDGETMNESEIQHEIEKFIGGVDASNDSLITRINRITAGASYTEEQRKAEKNSEGDFYTLPFSEGIWAVFQQSGLSVDELATLKVNKYQVYTPGYTSMRVEGQTHDLFKRVLLMDATELGDLERTLRQLRSATTGSQRRDALYNTWMQILKEYLGEAGNTQFKDLTMEQINRKLWELPGTNSLISNIKLKDIYNERKLTDSELNKYIDSILRKHSKIQNIFFSQGYKYGFRSNERPYYWIKEELLP